MGRRVDLTGKIFGRLTVLSFSHVNSNSKREWSCQCSCGNIKAVSGYCLTSGKTKSCGCILKTHGLYGTDIYTTWNNMVQRCTNKNLDSYIHYGGRGIGVCSRWLDDPRNFYEDMGDIPYGKSLDRINNNGNYNSSNCRWATNVEQAQNTRGTKLNPELVMEIRELGKTNIPFREIGEMYNITRANVGYIINRRTWKNVA